MTNKSGKSWTVKKKNDRQDMSRARHGVVRAAEPWWKKEWPFARNVERKWPPVAVPTATRLYRTAWLFVPTADGL